MAWAGVSRTILWRAVVTKRLAEVERIWIITERDRSATTLLLPDEY
jgi:hypothetical protein